MPSQPPPEPPEPPNTPPPPPPPGNPGALHWGRLLWPVAIVSAIVYALNFFAEIPALPEDSETEPTLLSPVAALSEARRASLALAERLRTSDLIDADATKLRQLASLDSLQAAGLLETATAWGFFGSLAKPLYRGAWTLDTVCRLIPAFELANALAFWLEVLGFYGGYLYGVVSAFGLLDGVYLGGSTGLAFCMVIELLIALAASYTLYWAVRHATADYGLIAICTYLAFGTLDLVYALNCVLDPTEPLRLIVYLLKTAAAFSCAFYALKICEQAEVASSSDPTTAGAPNALPEPKTLPPPNTSDAKELL